MGINYFTTWDLFGFLSSWNQEQHFDFLYYFSKGDYPFIFKSWCSLPLIEYVLGNPKHFHFSNFVLIKKYGKLWKALMAIPPLKHFLSFLSFTLFAISNLVIWHWLSESVVFVAVWQGKKTNWWTEFKAHFNISN